MTNEAKRNEDTVEPLVRHRFLDEFEEIKDGDEVCLGTWEIVPPSMVGAHWTRHLRQVRRCVPNKEPDMKRSTLEDYCLAGHVVTGQKTHTPSDIADAFGRLEREIARLEAALALAQKNSLPIPPAVELVWLWRARAEELGTPLNTPKRRKDLREYARVTAAYTQCADELAHIIPISLAT